MTDKDAPSADVHGVNVYAEQQTVHGNDPCGVGIVGALLLGHDSARFRHVLQDSHQHFVSCFVRAATVLLLPGDPRRVDSAPRRLGGSPGATRAAR